MRSWLILTACLGVACAHGDPRSMREPLQGSPKELMQQRTVDHSSEREGDGVPGRTAPLMLEEHPATGLNEADKPPASAAARPTALSATAGSPDMATPPPTPTGSAAPVPIQPTDMTPPKAAVPPSKPASATQVTNPVEERKPPPTLGADIGAADAELRERIQSMLLQRSDLSYTARHASVNVKDRNVTVKGQVRTAHERAEVEELIRKLNAVRDFRSELEVINTPPGPE